jgi:hypothetical protein
LGLALKKALGLVALQQTQRAGLTRRFHPFGEKSDERAIELHGRAQ